MNLQQIDVIALRAVQQPDCLFDTLGGRKDLILFGAGHLGRVALRMLRAAGREPIAFADNNPSLWYKPVDGLRVLPPLEAAAEYSDIAAFIVTIYNGSPVYQQLHRMGCRFVIPFPALSWKYQPDPGSRVRIAVDWPSTTLAHADEIEACASILADDASKKEFWGQIKWRCTMDYSSLPERSDPKDTYFDPALFQSLGEEEVFIDCGAFDGDTIRSFLQHRQGHFKRLIAIEPDPRNFSALGQYVDSLPEQTRVHIAVSHCAVGKQNGPVGFVADGTALSHVDPNHPSTVSCRSLDVLLKELRAVPTLIKMDIEANEPEAIEGAVQILNMQAPVLAICLYHRGEHLWQIPLLIRKLAPGYRLFIRRYAEECWELVCYAIPVSRLV